MDYKDYKAGQTNENFWFKGKNDLIDILMSKVSPLKKNGLKILNLGAGTGNDLEILNKYGDNYLIDIDKEALDMIKKDLYVEKTVADACAIPYENDFFDIVVSFDLFEHLENDSEAILEVYRVLKKEGSLIFTVPAFQFLFSGHDKALNHKRRYNWQALEKLLARFKNTNLYYWNSTTFPLVAVIRLARSISKPRIDSANFPKPINSLLYFFLKIENVFIKYDIPLPFGLSITGFCKK